MELDNAPNVPRGQAMSDRTMPRLLRTFPHREPSSDSAMPTTQQRTLAHELATSRKHRDEDVLLVLA